MSASLIIDFADKGEEISVSYRIRADETATAAESAAVLETARMVEDAVGKPAAKAGEGSENVKIC